MDNENMERGFPHSGLYHHIRIEGRGATVDISTPSNMMDFATFADFASYLALFCRDEEIQGLSKKHTKKILEKFYENEEGK